MGTCVGVFWPGLLWLFGHVLGCCELDLKQTQIHNTTVIVSALHCCSHSLMVLRGSDRAQTELCSEKLHDLVFWDVTPY